MLVNMFSRAYVVVFILVSVETSTVSSISTDGLELVSLYKNATQSSTHQPGVATKAVDGGTNGNYFSHSCTHTSINKSNPWWYVDLESPTKISKIVIYNRDDCCGERLSGAVVSIGSDNVAPFNGNTQCGPTVMESFVWYYPRRIELTCFPAIEGQYISVYLHSSKALSLCELKAYKDIRSPDLLCPKDIAVGAGVNQNLNPVVWSDPIAVDNVDNVNTTCTPASGSIFDVGFTKVICSARDSSGNEGNCSFVVNIVDEEEPTLICPEHITVNSNIDQSEDPVIWDNPTVTDNVHTGMAVTCAPVSGSIFDVGSTIVTCSATDGAGNEGSCGFVVHVIGQTYLSDVPTIMCPHNITVSRDQPVNSITWNDPKVLDNVDTDLVATCSPTTGSSFEVGSTTVTCSATNSFGIEGNCSFVVNITVTGYKSLPEAISHGGDDSDNTRGYMIGVVILGVMVLLLSTALVIIVVRYYTNKNVDGGIYMYMEDNNVSRDRLK